MENFPEGKFLTTVKIGPKGQIVIPKEVRDMFSLNTGDSLLLMADKGQVATSAPASTHWMICWVLRIEAANTWVS